LGLSSGLSFFVLAFPTLSESVPLAFQVIRFRAFPFPAVPTLPDHFRAVSDLDLNSAAVGGPLPFGAPPH
ncbi:hypothetical protein ACIGXG_19470, partial [Streptomyces goshikiensis]|uniref:hypothetical protein n=1 Tax=Streptomyces goshikiensis TaxID=1942 RepID=UPI0037D5F3AF